MDFSRTNAKTSSGRRREGNAYKKSFCVTPKMYAKGKNIAAFFLVSYVWFYKCVSFLLSNGFNYFFRKKSGKLRLISYLRNRQIEKRGREKIELGRHNGPFRHYDRPLRRFGKEFIPLSLGSEWCCKKRGEYFCAENQMSSLSMWLRCRVPALSWLRFKVEVMFICTRER